MLLINIVPVLTTHPIGTLPHHASPPGAPVYSTQAKLNTFTPDHPTCCVRSCAPHYRPRRPLRLRLRRLAAPRLDRQPRVVRAAGRWAAVGRMELVPGAAAHLQADAPWWVLLGAVSGAAMAWDGAASLGHFILMTSEAQAFQMLVGWLANLLAVGSDGQVTSRRQ